MGRRLRVANSNASSTRSAGTRVLVELWDHGEPTDTVRNDALYELACLVGVGCVATNNVHYATPPQRKLATALAAVRSRRSLDDIDAWLPSGAGAHLRSGAEQAQRFRRYPGAVEMTVEIARAAAFDLSLVAPNLPPFPCPNDHDGRPVSEMGYLRQLVDDGAGRRYGERPGPASEANGMVGEDLSLRARAWKTIDHELALIEKLDFAGYFLIVWDLVEFCRRSNIYCQGREVLRTRRCVTPRGHRRRCGVARAAVRAVPVAGTRRPARHRHRHRERPTRRGHPVRVRDLRSSSHGTGRERDHVSVAVVDPGHGQGARLRAGSAGRVVETGRCVGNVAATAEQDDCTIPPAVLELAAQVEDAPRHLGIHSGGMVICDRPVVGCARSSGGG